MPPRHDPTTGLVPDRTIARDPIVLAAGAAVLLLAAAAWGHVIWGMGDHADMATTGWRSTLLHGSAYVLSWGVMMAAMMLPSALPMIALYGAIQRKATGSGRTGVHVAVFTLVYLAVWMATGVPVYLAGRALDGVAPALVPYGVAIALLAAGAYQLSPIKRVCLRACRSPIGFLLGRFRPGRVGALALASGHALYCVGCCWALMAVLVAAGAMGLTWVLSIAVVVAAEKLLPYGERIARLAGVALIVLGVAVAAWPPLAMLLRDGHLM